MKRAFTLIELIVVIAIITILAAVLFPVFSQAREKARASACLSNEKQIGLSTMQYVQDYDETFPYCSGIGWQNSLFPYIKSVNVFMCPSNPGNVHLFYGNGTDGQQFPVSYAVNRCYSISSRGHVKDGIMGYTDQYGITYSAQMSDIVYPASCIVVMEGNWQYTGMSPADPTYHGNNGYSGATRNVALFAGHQQMTNYVYADGHSRPLKPWQTVLTAEGGSGAVDFWTKDGSAFPSTDIGAAQYFLSLCSNYYQ